MQTATSETESKSRELSICVHHYTLRAPCPKGQGTVSQYSVAESEPHTVLVAETDTLGEAWSRGVEKTGWLVE